MDSGWIVLVVGSAFVHAAWNALLKGGKDRVAFTLMMILASLVLYLPFFIVVKARTGPLVEGSLKWIAASGIVHTMYFYLLSLAYEAADLSIAYPVARGSGSALAVLGGILLLGEKPSAAGWAGIGFLIAGVSTLLSLGTSKVPDEPAKISTNARLLTLRAALATGISIGGYSLIDKQGVAITNPFVHLYLSKVVCVVPYALIVLARASFGMPRGTALERFCRRLRVEWMADAKAVLAAGFFSPLTYAMVLFAARACNISYVAPLRETSVVFSLLLARNVLGERATGGRWAGTLAVMAGVILIGLA